MRRILIIFLLVIGIPIKLNAQDNSLLRKADNERSIGNYANSAKLYTRFLSELQLGRFTATKLLSAYSGRAFCYKRMAQYSRANADYDEAIKVAVYLQSDINQYFLYANKSDLLIQMGAYEEAEKLLLSIPSDLDTLKTHRLSNLSLIYQLQGKTVKAISMLDEVLSEETETNIRRVALHNRGMCYMDLDVPDYTKAARDFDSALSIDLKKNDEYHIVLTHKALVDAFLGNYDNALFAIRTCMKWFRSNQGSLHPNYIMSLRVLGSILSMKKDFSAAEDAYTRYFETDRLFVLSNFMSMTEQNRLDFWKKEKSFLSEVFAIEKNSTDLLFNVAIFRRQIALLGRNDSLTISQKLSYTKKQIAQNLNKKEIAIEFIKYEKNNKNRYAALIIAGSDKKHVRFVPLWVEDSIKSYNVGGNRLDSALCSKQKTDKDKVYQNESLSKFVWGKILPFIPEGSTIYFAPDGILHLLAIEYLPTVNNGKYELHRLTTTALLAEKKKGKNKSIPKALIVGGMDYDIIPPKDSSITIQANHDAYNYLRQNKKMLYFTYLLGSKMESDSIEKYLSSTDRYEDIDEATLKHRMGNYNNIHLATHGYSWHVDVPSVPYAFRDSITEDKSLLASGIAISGANWVHLFPKREDGLLSARELCEMNLTGVDLVVASSCQSAQGRVSDEGPTGLVRGLKKAGVKTIIASLWPVSDKATMLLMQFFYDEWREGKGKDGKGCSKTRALHLAQKKLKEIEGNPVRVRTYNTSNKTGAFKIVTTKYDTPYYWAPFIIIDDI